MRGGSGRSVRIRADNSVAMAELWQVMPGSYNQLGMAYAPTGKFRDRYPVHSECVGSQINFFVVNYKILTLACSLQTINFGSSAHV